MVDREAYRKRLEAQLAEWQAEIDRMRAKAEKANADVRIRWEEEIERLKARREEAEGQLERLGAASEAAFEDMRKGLDAAWSEIGESFRRAWSRFD